MPSIGADGKLGSVTWDSSLGVSAPLFAGIWLPPRVLVFTSVFAFYIHHIKFSLRDRCALFAGWNAGWKRRTLSPTALRLHLNCVPASIFSSGL